MAPNLTYSADRWVDEGFYYAQNPDVAASGADPVEHYVAFGRFEGRSPNALFDAGFYLAENPEVAAAGADPLEHYLTTGWREGRDPNPLFSTNGYLASNPDVAAAGLNPLEHYIDFGWKEPRPALEGFDTAYYLASNPDVAAAGVNPLAHYLTFGQGEGRRPVPPTFTAAVEDGTVRFAGTATGDIDLALDGDAAVFTRAGIEARVADLGDVDGIDLGGLALNAEAPALSGKDVTGGGDLVLTGVEADTDLSGVDGAIAVVVQVAEDLDLSANAALKAVDTYEVARGATLTLSVQQAEAAEIAGRYAIRDTAANLFDNAGVRPVAVAAEGGVTVAGTASIAELGDLADAIEGELAYGSVADTAGNLVSDGEAHPFVTPGTDVEVTGAATIAQLAALDDANGDGELAYGSIADTAANLVTGAGASAYVAAGTDVVVLGTATIAQLAALDAANGDGDLSYGSVTDAAPALAGNGGGYVVAGLPVVVTGAATVAELSAIDAANGGGALAYGALADTAANLVTGAGASAYVAAGTDVEVTGAATIAQLAALDDANGDGDLSYDSVADALANLLVAGGAHPYVVPGTDVAATGTATVAQLAALDAANGDGALTCTALTDTWQNVLSDEAAGFLAGVGTVKLADYDLGQATVAEVRALLETPNLRDGAGESLELGDLAFTLRDTAANLASWGPMAIEIVERASAVEASNAASVPQAETIHDRNAAAVYDVADSPYAIAYGGADAVTAAVDLTATYPATAEQAVAIVGRDGPEGDVAFGIRDTFVKTDGIAAAVRDAATDITVTTQSYGWPPFLTTAQATIVLGYGNAGRTDIEYVRGTAAEIDAFVTANQETAGPTGIGYDFWVQDSPSAILAALDDDADSRAFLTGNPAPGLGGDHRAANVEVAGSFAVAGAEAFWAEVEPVFVGAETTSARTTYGINDAVASYDNASADGAAVVGADYLRVSDTAAHVHAAQNGLDAGHSRIFALLDARQSYADAIYVTGSSGNQYIRGTAGYDSVSLGDGYDAAFTGDGGDFLDGGADGDGLSAGNGDDTVYGGTGGDVIYGEGGKDILYAGEAAAATSYADARYRPSNAVTGGEGGDNMFGSADFDAFRYEGQTRWDFQAESGTTQYARDYVTNFGLGDRIEFSAVGNEDVQFFGAGSANAEDVEAGTLALSIRYEKNAQVLNWGGDGLVAATRVLVDVADEAGHFDDVADMQIILVGNDIDVNWGGSSIVFGG